MNKETKLNLIRILSIVDCVLLSELTEDEDNNLVIIRDKLVEVLE